MIKGENAFIYYNMQLDYQLITKHNFLYCIFKHLKLTGNFNLHQNDILRQMRNYEPEIRTVNN